jgi:tyrosine-protein phosphatase MSG5
MLAPPPPGRRAKRAPPALALAKPQTTDIQLEPELPPSPPKPKHKPRAKPAKNLNLKGLALALVPPPDAPAALLESPVSGGPVASEALVPQSPLPVHPPPPRRPSVVSLPASAAIPPTPAAAVVGFRKEEDGSPTAPYPDGPIEIMPRVWIGTDDHARDWQGLRDRGIRSIVNVAKELASPFEPPSTSLRSTYSTSDIPRVADPTEPRPVYYPANLQSGRPAFHYLKMPWSHGQANLVKQGFPVAMEFIDKALQRGDGVLIQYVPPTNLQ